MAMPIVWWLDDKEVANLSSEAYDQLLELTGNYARQNRETLKSLKEEIEDIIENE